MSVSADFLRSQINYTRWASLRLLEAAAALTPEELAHDFRTADHTIPRTLAHTFAGDRVWLARLSGRADPQLLTDEDRRLSAVQSAWPPLLDRWQEWAAGLTDEQASGSLFYTDQRGHSWTQPVWQVVLHVVNHGTHHRGQVSGFLRILGHTPPVLDLHLYYRQQ